MVNNIKQRLLIVDDTGYVRTFLLCCLGNVYECEATASAEEAAERLRTEEFELVITDISMPGMSGLELCKYIRRNYPKTVVVVMSGNQEQAYEMTVKQLGAFGFLKKPFGAQAVLGIVRAALASQGYVGEWQGT